MIPETLIRPARVKDAPAIARVHVETWRTAYAGIVSGGHLAGLSVECAEAGWREHLALPEEATYVAEEPSGRVVGFASGGPARDALPGYDAEIYTLYVLQSCQGVGLGRRLFERAARDLAGRGYRSLILWVLKDNPARGFYERLGGQPAGEKTVEIGGEHFVDVGYGWADIGAVGRQQAES